MILFFDFLKNIFSSDFRFFSFFFVFFRLFSFFFVFFRFFCFFVKLDFNVKMVWYDTVIGLECTLDDSVQRTLTEII